MFANVKFAALFTLVVLAVPSFSAPIPASEILPAPTAVPVMYEFLEAAYTARSERCPSNPIAQRSDSNGPQGGRVFPDVVDPEKREPRKPPTDHAKPAGPPQTPGARRDDPYSNGIGSMSMMPDGLQQVAQDLTNKMNAMQIANNLNQLMGNMGRELDHRADDNKVNAQAPDDLSRFVSFMNHWAPNAHQQEVGHGRRDDPSYDPPREGGALADMMTQAFGLGGGSGPAGGYASLGRRDDGAKQKAQPPHSPDSKVAKEPRDGWSDIIRAMGGASSMGSQGLGATTVGQRDEAQHPFSPHFPEQPRDGWADILRAMGGASTLSNGLGASSAGNGLGASTVRWRDEQEPATHAPEIPRNRFSNSVQGYNGGSGMGGSGMGSSGMMSSRDNQKPLTHAPETPRNRFSNSVQGSGGGSGMSSNGMGNSGMMSSRDEQKPATHAPEAPRNWFSSTVGSYRGGSGMSSSGMGSSGVGQRDEQKPATHAPETPRNQFSTTVSGFRDRLDMGSGSMTTSGVGHRSVHEARDLEGKAATKTTPHHTDGSGEVIRPFIQRSAQIAKRVMDLGCTGLEGEDAIKCSGSKPIARLTHIQRASDMILNEVRNNKELLSAARDLVEKMKRALDEESAR
ncbi:hypothetical protein NLI96_g12259 [Meripilus lineatus]|uniref:Uncharacterized protein n=1 Tax=Meripilus lineatus TaxID=2056292 RepID=A0AAD5YA16_9APHY|nr:hypothetical protein NLI96_g12259 [Physisporinus lineatus]